MDAIAGFCDTRSLRSSRDLLWDMFSAALSGEDAQYTGRQAGEWALLYRQPTCFSENHLQQGRLPDLNRQTERKAPGAAQGCRIL
jgi:hypothetical protein